VDESGGTAQRIRPVSLLVDGRHGQVYVGMDQVLRRRVVVRRLALQSFENAEARTRLIEEARLLSQIDHPNILRIHDYHEQDGFDVFTLEFAGGTKLSRALEEGIDFAKKVRIATAVASALVIAHRHGIVHGALSADSVLLTDNGEIKIVDFTSTSTTLEVRAGGRKRPDDMYALGLLLRQLFGEGDRDVRAIVASLLREAPSERATAAVTLTSLHHLGRRQARRVRTAAVIVVLGLFIFGGVKYAGDLQRERKEALAAKAEAEARRAEVNQLVAFMIRDLRPKLESVGRLDILDSATAKGLDYFASTSPDDLSPDEAAIHIDALVHLGHNHLARGNLPAAMTAYRRAVSLGEAMTRRAPENLEIRYATASGQVMISQLLDRQGDTAGALRHAEAFAATAADLVRRAPDNLRFVRYEAIAHSNLGANHDRREEIAQSLPEFVTAVDLKRRAVKISDAPELRVDLAVTINKVGIALFKLGRLREAQTMLEEERKHLESMSARQSRDQLTREVLARFDDSLAMIALAEGDLAAAERYAAAHLARSRELLLVDSRNLDWVRQMALARTSSGTIARLRGDLPGALAHHHAAISMLEAVSSTQARWLVRDLAAARTEHARTLLAAHLAAAASDEAHRAVESLRQIPDDLPARRILGDALLVNGEARAARGDSAGATALWEEALRVVGPLDAITPDPRVADTHARVLFRLGRGDSARATIEELVAINYRSPELEALSGPRRLKGEEP